MSFLEKNNNLNESNEDTTPIVRPWKYNNPSNTSTTTNIIWTKRKITKKKENKENKERKKERKC